MFHVVWGRPAPVSVVRPRTFLHVTPRPGDSCSRPQRESKRESERERERESESE